MSDPCSSPPSNPSRQPLLLAGPTGVGKSAVALCLAQQLPGEIVSVDSMQVYRGMDVGTAKPSLVDRERVPHHLIDILDFSETFDAARFLEAATAAVHEIRVRHRVPLLCGGTGLYFQAFLDGLGEAPAADPHLRVELDKIPLPLLLEELKRTDPEAFVAIDRSNRRRVVRAVEVLRLTGKTVSEQRAIWNQRTPGAGAVPDAGCFFVVLNRAKADLQQRIDRRVEQMFADGLVEEVRRLLGQGLLANLTARQAIGYRQVAAYLQGHGTIEETITLVKQKTRQYAKRQLTWLRRQRRAQWIQVEPEESLEHVAARLRTLYVQSNPTP